MRVSHSILVQTIVAAALLAPPLAAHDLWLAPSSFSPALGEPIRLHLVLGSGDVTEVVPRAASTIVRFVAIGPDGSQEVPGMDGLDPAGFLRPSSPGWYTILYESSPAFTTLAPDTFRAYLLEKGLQPAAAQAAAQTSPAFPEEPTTELFRRSLKARIRVVSSSATSSPGDPEVSDPGGEPPVGLPLELVLERTARDERTAPAHEVVVRLLLDGAPLAAARVDLRRLDGAAGTAPEKASATTDDAGRVHLSLGAGSWLATAVHLDAASPATADWESVWASLTFELR